MQVLYRFVSRLDEDVQRRLGKGLKLGTEAACAIAVADHDANVSVRFDLRDFGQSSLIGLGVDTDDAAAVSRRRAIPGPPGGGTGW